MNRQEKINDLKTRILGLKLELEELESIKEKFVVVTSSTNSNWYKVGEVYKVVSVLEPGWQGGYYPLVGEGIVGIGPENCVFIEDDAVTEVLNNAGLGGRKV